MERLVVSILVALPFLYGTALAEVIKEGNVSNGYYWQLIQTNKGTRWLCRKVGVAKFQSHNACTNIGAKKP